MRVTNRQPSLVSIRVGVTLITLGRQLAPRGLRLKALMPIQHVAKRRDVQHVKRTHLHCDYMHMHSHAGVTQVFWCVCGPHTLI